MAGVGFDESIVRGIRAGLTKINVSTHLNAQFTGAIREYLTANPAAIDPRRYVAAGAGSTSCGGPATAPALPTARLGSFRRTAGAGCLTKGLPVALAEDGTIWRLHLVGSHVVVDGATGSGKSAVLWSIIGGPSEQITAGLVKVWAVDPKGGMELAAGRHLFDWFAYGDSRGDGGYEASLAQLLEDAVQVMRERKGRLRGVTRRHRPSMTEPLIVLLIDELAALTAWINDRTIKRRIESALGLLLSQGRAPGVVVVGAIQEPRKTGQVAGLAPTLRYRNTESG